MAKWNVDKLCRDQALQEVADDIWAEFKDKWEGERKYALRQIVKWLKGDKDGDDTGS